MDGIEKIALQDTLDRAPRSIASGAEKARATDAITMLKENKLPITTESARRFAREYEWTDLNTKTLEQLIEDILEARQIKRPDQPKSWKDNVFEIWKERAAGLVNGEK